MDKKQATKLAKFAAILYVASFLIINWTDVSWIFNYKEVSNLVEDFFNPYPSIDSSTMNAYFYPNHSQTTKTTNNTIETVSGTVTTTNPVTTVKEEKPAVTEIKTTYTDKQNTIEIPKINMTAPIVFSQSNNKASITKDLDSGVVYYPGSVYPGQSGQIVILGHSAPAGWPKTKYEWVFSDLNKLEVGDKILIDLNSKQYTYIVKQKNIIARGADLPVYNSATNTGVLTLISCWPPGKDYQRITVQAELSNE
jgi:LPXTG-site transpeptidase (sortase) family protein